MNYKIFLIVIILFIVNTDLFACRPTLSIELPDTDYQSNDDLIVKIVVENTCEQNFVADLRVMHMDQSGKFKGLLSEVPYFLPLDSGQKFEDIFILNISPDFIGGVHQIKVVLADYYSMDHIAKKSHGLKIKLDSALAFDFVKISKGTFTMGSPSGEVRRSNNENQVEVTFSNNYFVQDSEVTQLHWYLVMKNNPSFYKVQKYCPDTYIKITDVDLCPNHPVDKVSLEMAKRFVSTFNGLNSGEVVRLLTEAEWEFAARANTLGRFSFGENEDLLGLYSWHKGNSKINNMFQSHPIKQKLPNPNGLYDIHGNVSEITSSYYSRSNSGGVDPTGAQSGTYFICRGGNYYSFPGHQRSAYRGTCYSKNEKVGLRLAKDF